MTLLTREHGRLQALAKGAHRLDSPLLGRLDFLNELQVRLSPDRGGLRLLLAADLLRERRGLRAPARFLAASHIAELCDFGFPAERPDPGLFDLLHGGLNLLELCPVAAIPVVVLGLELRFLQGLGALPDLDRCGDCGSSLAHGAFRGETEGSLACRTHNAAPARSIGAAALALLRMLRDLPGKRWPELSAQRIGPTAAALPAMWLATALDHQSRIRAHVFRRPDSRLGRRRAVDNGA